ncbi:zinc finger protein 347 isoform X2 [Aedes albopictus]|uniref:C2h2-type zn-finger protein n=1 Tax=Aedes albopictus TaxID=7160 RepID=A0ABM1YT93_AEDAL|nr:zinc finger protein 347-like isoform X2 [Aedes albopictus]XP_029711132.1 zinc finger protein 347-like isoform X2 [Aedes albopictus]XP_029711134.1 zinc finger protein 347-like isoform X2 [Aedes albopictus]XP_029711135.1 zinc finger protein 347-like isoform X2 [Aedes albopictus]XP_029711136.1 zinc finger protein 347-like isoform X2 [Aedes albopictus]XP_029711137.1 zinc finger protein 347-like isoform X2 [Aedes albopictus]
MSNLQKRPPASTSMAKCQQPPQEEQSADSVCRVCMGRASDAGQMVGLFDGQIQGTILAEVLTLVGSVELATKDDRLPKWCCEGCLKALESAYKLRMLCQDSDRKLRDALSTAEETVVVKQEVDEDSRVGDGMLDVEEAVLSESIQLPKLEIMDCLEEDEITDDGDGEDDMVEADGGADSDVEEAEQDKDEKMSEKVNRPTHGKKPLNPDVFDEVEAVGFKCCGCKVTFNTLNELQAHSKEAHADKKLAIQELQRKKQCDICYKVLYNDLSVRNHQYKDKLNFRCKVCGELFWSRQRVCLHYDRVHGPNPVIKGPSKVCCACLEKFETEEQLRAHSLAVHLPEKPPPDPARPFTCNVCYRCYKSDGLLYSHQSRMLRDTKKHVCAQCGLTFRYPGALEHHRVVHTGEKKFQCTNCPKAYSNWNSFRKHVNNHKVPADKYKCEICGDIFKTNIGLKQHTLQHTGERPHKCPHCSATFTVPSGLRCHLLTHTDEKKLECPICRKKFKRNTALKQHIQYIHHKQRPYVCFFCPNRYQRKHQRKQHMLQVHPKELQSNPLPPIELLGNPWSLRQRTEEDFLRELGMVE